MVERNDGQKEAGTLCSKEGQREKERQGKERWKRQEEKEIKDSINTQAYIFTPSNTDPNIMYIIDFSIINSTIIFMFPTT